MSRTISEGADALPGLAETFREYGFSGASLSLISKATGLGKGSLYNFFPAGKKEMMAAVLSDIDRWFEQKIFVPLERTADPAAAVANMFDEITEYFRSGQRICLVGALGMSASREPFAESIAAYFARWIATLTAALTKGNMSKADASSIAEETIAGIQGAIILSRALDDTGAFDRVIGQYRVRLLDAIGS